MVTHQHLGHRLNVVLVEQPHLKGSHLLGIAHTDRFGDTHTALAQELARGRVNAERVVIQVAAQRVSAHVIDHRNGSISRCFGSRGLRASFPSRRSSRAALATEQEQVRYHPTNYQRERAHQHQPNGQVRAALLSWLSCLWSLSSVRWNRRNDSRFT